MSVRNCPSLNFGRWSLILRQFREIRLENVVFVLIIVDEYTFSWVDWIKFAKNIDYYNFQDSKNRLSSAPYRHINVLWGLRHVSHSVHSHRMYSHFIFFMGSSTFILHWHQTIDFHWLNEVIIWCSWRALIAHWCALIAQFGSWNRTPLGGTHKNG